MPFGVGGLGEACGHMRRPPGCSCSMHILDRWAAWVFFLGLGWLQIWLSQPSLPGSRDAFGVCHRVKAALVPLARKFNGKVDLAVNFLARRV